MQIEFDPVKRTLAFETRGVDMARAGEVFAAITMKCVSSPSACWTPGWSSWCGHGIAQPAALSAYGRPMTVNKPSMDPDWSDSDDAPDLSAPEWQVKFAKAPVRRGRPKADAPKISTTIRLDADLVEYFRAGGPGWQSRLNDALRRTVAAERNGAGSP